MKPRIHPADKLAARIGPTKAVFVYFEDGQWRMRIIPNQKSK